MSAPAAPEAGDGPRIIGWCAWHKNIADGVRVIQVDEQGSGRGGVRYACGPCQVRYDLTPFADREAS
ncbi:hypothetical protein [Streptomyces sp. STCH 565 A]|uniref:hypothetical protein n=1 Tax=Streptomyces sp. STCH 565 A TaxID=2950532 RepID=UPI002075DA35|nr:hypothetical protein [Streptomyces sp. STCH 565 A]MCM8548869.1 hypothetical protein [Streptomyces sp. STCH 565 A]